METITIYLVWLCTASTISAVLSFVTAWRFISKK